MPAATSAHSREVTGHRGAVAAAHPLAVAAGVRMLSDGGSAVDAAIAAQAAICVLMPHAAGLGGDLMALVHQPDGRVVAVNGAGRSPAGAPEHASDGAAPRVSDGPAPRVSDGAVPYPTDGGASVTVPGLVDGWVEAHRRWGRLPLAAALAPAAELAGDGVPVGSDLAAAVAAQGARLRRGGAGAWPLLSLAPGDRWRQPELAALLRAVGERGRDAFYDGPVADATADAVRRCGGALSVGDLRSHGSQVGDPVTVAWAGGRLHVQPPSSQGVLLAMAARWLERAAPTLDAGALDHVLVEVTEAAFAHRDACARGGDLLGVPLDVDRRRARRRGGPRAYLHTAGVAVADRHGQVVSSLVSVFDDFGSGVFVPAAGIVLNNRGAGFTAGANAPGPGRRPVHTLAPALVVDPAGAPLALATPGADGQVQTLLQLLARRRCGADLATALAAPRWRSQAGTLLVEHDHPNGADLAARGHAIRAVPAGDELFGAVVAAGTGAAGPFAAADWRRFVWSGVA